MSTKQFNNAVFESRQSLYRLNSTLIDKERSFDSLIAERKSIIMETMNSTFATINTRKMEVEASLTKNGSSISKIGRSIRELDSLVSQVVLTAESKSFATKQRIDDLNGQINSLVSKVNKENELIEELLQSKKKFSIKHVWYRSDVILQLLYVGIPCLLVLLFLVILLISNKRIARTYLKKSEK
ncbi:MAG: hypothetical protein AAFQ94_02540 [Bacteroidota bacterium]